MENIASNIFTKMRLYLLDYVTRRSEKWDFQNKRKIQRFCLILLQKCLLLVSSKITEKILISKLCFTSVINYAKITIRVSRVIFFFFFFFFFFAIADLKHISRCNVIQQIKNKPRLIRKGIMQHTFSYDFRFFLSNNSCSQML